MTATVKAEKTKWSMARTFQTFCLQRESPGLPRVPVVAKEDFAEKTLSYNKFHIKHSVSACQAHPNSLKTFHLCNFTSTCSCHLKSEGIKV